MTAAPGFQRDFDGNRFILLRMNLEANLPTALRVWISVFDDG